MIPIALSFLFGLAMVLGIGSPMAVAELRSGRAAFLAVQAERAADGALAEWSGQRWVDSTPGVPAGIGIAFDSVSFGNGVVVTRRIERLGRDIWLLDASARRRDANGSIRARSRRGWVAKVGPDPADSTLGSVLVSRARVPAFQ